MRLGAFLMLVVCTTASLVWAQDDSDAAVRSSIIALEKAWNQAYKAATSGRLTQFLTRDCTDQRRPLRPEQGRVSGKRQGQQQQFSGTAGLAGIDERARVWQHRNLDRSISSHESRGRKELRAARAFCRYLDLQER